MVASTFVWFRYPKTTSRSTENFFSVTGSDWSVSGLKKLILIMLLKLLEIIRKIEQ